MSARTPPACSTCHDVGKIENWDMRGSSHEIKTTFIALKANYTCILCTAIWHGVQCFPRGQELFRQNKPLTLRLLCFKHEMFRVRYELGPTKPSVVEYQFDLILSPKVTADSPAVPHPFKSQRPLSHDVQELSAVPSYLAIPSTPLSENTRTALMSRISDCTDNHEHSRATNSHIMPDRLIDTGPADGTQNPKLIITTSQTAKPYLALSHCWGGTMPFRLLTSNLSSLMQSLPFSALPKNIQDAITVTRWLRFRYIWIDSFCIIQDSTSDWLAQAAKMGDIYAGAFLTISATRSASYSAGFLGTRRSDIEISAVNGMLPPRWGLYVRDSDKLEAGYNSISGAIPSPVSPLCKRAWCFQERLLAQRVLHFLEGELALECEEGLVTECDEEQDGYDTPPEKQIYQKNEDGLPLVMWETLVEHYTSRQLTYHHDVLPAISAVARDYQIENYIAGLDGENLMWNLLWKALIWKTVYSEVKIPRRSNDYVAPTFSWASVIGQIGWESAESLDRASASFEFVSSLQDWHVSLEDLSNQFGRVKDGWIKLKGPTLTVTMGARARVDGDLVKGSLYCGSRKIVGCFDALDDPSAGVSLKCLTLCLNMSWYYQHFGLILKSSQLSGVYERVGCYWGAAKEVFDGSREESVTIV
ncbi:MAG: hypothetical protein Q9214_001587 [Letrouitia sp. 1 TL-2023]